VTAPSPSELTSAVASCSSRVRRSGSTDALGAGARPVYALSRRPVYALSHRFAGAFAVEVGILLTAALMALVLLRREGRVGHAAGVDRAVATSR
jgi:hypothetical protein